MIHFCAILDVALSEFLKLRFRHISVAIFYMYLGTLLLVLDLSVNIKHLMQSQDTTLFSQ